MNKYSLSVLKKWLFRCWCSTVMILLLALLMAPSSYGQIVTEGATVKVNFGIDADIYANQLTVWQGDSTLATDDWFDNDALYPGGGLGVIDQTNAAALLTAVQANYNTSFELRMSSTPDRNWTDPSTGLLWIDAVYFRDWNSQGSFNDMSVFTAGQDKNGADPSTWSLGTGGTPQKNDLVDVMGHMRQDTNGDIYGIGAFTTISSDGNSHADFEFFQNQIDFVGGALTNLGDDAGHTAWEFDATDVTQVGDLIVSIDFENGGTDPQASVRLWMSDATFAALSSSIPTNVHFTLTGEFNSGEGADGYGYAEIEATGAFAVAWAIVNVNEAVLGAPWGSLEAKAWYEDIQELQYAEFAINLTDIGIGDFGGTDPCNKTLGSLLVKTRSSSSFTAELKDFAGPFLFGYELTTDVAVHDSEECQDEVSYDIDLTANVDTTFGNVITYHNSFDDATEFEGVISDSTSHNIPLNEMPKTIYVRASNPQDIECFVVDSFTIGFYPNPVCDITPYDASNIYTYDGAAKVNTPDIVSYSWYTTDGLIGGGATNDSIWGLKGSLDGIEYYVDLEDVNGCTVTCTTTIYAGTYAPPDCTVEVVDATCDGFNDGSAKLQDVPPNWADYDYEWFKLPDEVTVIGTDTMITDLDSGTYKLVITDNNLDVPQSTECEGTVSDRDPVVLTCPGDYLENACTDATDIKTHFDNWMAGVSVIGSDSMLTTNWDSLTYPDICGDTITVTWTLHDECANPNTCSATFRLPAPDDLVVSDPSDDDTNSSCDYDNQQQLSDAFDSWMSTSLSAIQTELTGQGCDPQVTENDWDGVYPVLCEGDTITVTWTIEDLCDETTVSATFGVSAAPAVTWTEPSDSVNAMCAFEDQAALDLAFDNWLTYVEGIANVNGGCNPVVTNNAIDAPNVCLDDTVTVTWTIEDLCETNYFDAKFIVTGDTVKPVITLPTDYEDYVCDIAVPASLTATWTDNCMDGSMNVVSTRELTVDTTCGQTYTYYFEVQDACGNMAKDSLTISREYVSLEECETAFAKLEDELPDPLQAYDPVRNPDPYGLTDDSTAIGSRCFIDDVFNRWGWVNRIREDSTYYLPVYAGAGQCDVSAGYLVGTAELIFEDGTVTVNFDLDDPWVLTEAHVYAGTGMYPLLTKGKKVDATVAPGQYNLVYENGDPLTGFTLDITDASRYIYVIIHAVTCRPTCVCDGTVFDEMDWGTTATAITNSMSTKVKGPKKVETLDYVEGEFNVFPNPFDEAVNFEFVPAVSGHAVLEIHNMLGQRVVRLLDKPVEAGELQRVEFRPETEISGMYLYRLDINGDTRIGKLIYRNK